MLQDSFSHALQLQGTRQTGEDVRTANGTLASCAAGPVLCGASRGQLGVPNAPAPWLTSACAPAVNACIAVANIVKTSLGPVGLDKARRGLGG